MATGHKVDESVEATPRGVSFASILFFLSLTLIQASRSSESSPVVQQDTLAGNGLEMATKTPSPQPRRVSKHDLPWMITMSQAARRRSSLSLMISSRRLSTLSESSTSTHVEILDTSPSPLQRKCSLPLDIYHIDICSSTSSNLKLCW